MFEKLLPCAIALKTEKVGGDKFEKTLIQSMQFVDPYAAVWYSGTSVRPMNFANNLKQSLTNNIQHSATSPNSSGGNWCSGSSAKIEPSKHSLLIPLGAKARLHLKSDALSNLTKGTYT